MRRRLALLVVAGLMVAAAAGAASLGLVFRVESDSMAPTTDRGDVVLATRLDGAGVGRSDIVVFRDPGGWAERVERLTGAESGSVSPTFVKRVVGLPGERVVCCDVSGRITIDGVALDEPYRAAGPLASILAFDRVVPDGSLFVLGDNRVESVDSRVLGVVPMASVLGVERMVLTLPW